MEDTITKIENLIESIEAKPHLLDIDLVYNTLLEARESIVNGLKRSPQGEKFSVLQEQVVSLKLKVKELLKAISDLRNDASRSTENNKHLSDFFLQLKRITKAHLDLAYPQAEVRLALSRKIDDCQDACEFLQIKSGVDSDLKKKYSDPPGIVSLEKQGSHANLKPYLIGGGP